MQYKIHPLLNGFFTVAFDKESGVKFPKVENIPSFSFLIIDENNEPLLVDTGFDIDHIPGPESKGIRGKEHQLEWNLAGFGFTPSDIKTVIQTHLHWDHAAGIGMFNNAEIFVQKTEFEGLFRLRENEETSFCPHHWIDSLNRFRLVHGNCHLKPGLELIHTSGHTDGHQSVRIKTEQGFVTLIGDSPFTYEWLWTLVPDDLWKKYRIIGGERFFWKESLEHKLKEWLDNQPLYRCDDSAEDKPDRKEEKIFSHDPSLLNRSIL